MLGAVAEALYDGDDGDAEEEGHEAAHLRQELDPVLGEVGDHLHADKFGYQTTGEVIRYSGIITRYSMELRKNLSITTSMFWKFSLAAATLS